MLRILIFVFFVSVAGIFSGLSQPLTGIWQGRLRMTNVPTLAPIKLELKLARMGDSLTGTAYYFQTPRSYARYSVKGFQDALSGTVFWWNQDLIEVKGKLASVRSDRERFSFAVDFSCPNGREMFLEGYEIEEGEQGNLVVELRKGEDALYQDEWNTAILRWNDGEADPGEIARLSREQEVRNINGQVADNQPLSPPSPVPDIAGIPGADRKSEPIQPAMPDLEVEKPVPPAGDVAVNRPAADPPAPRAVMPPADPGKRPVENGRVSQQVPARPVSPPGNTPAQTRTTRAPQNTPAQQAAPPRQPEPVIVAQANPEPSTRIPLPEAKTPVSSSVSVMKQEVSQEISPQRHVIAQKFNVREKEVQTIIEADQPEIVLQFYDNAEIDGDSISLFLNGKMLFEHVRLTAQPFILTLNADELPESSELVMVAENLGEIPPNTAFMLAYSGLRRISARLESTEQKSAVIRIEKRRAENPEGQ